MSGGARSTFRYLLLVSTVNGFTPSVKFAATMTVLPSGGAHGQHRHAASIVGFAGDDLRSLGNVARIVLHGVIFGSVKIGASLGVDAYQGVLLPSPRAFAVV